MAATRYLKISTTGIQELPSSHPHPLMHLFNTIHYYVPTLSLPEKCFIRSASTNILEFKSNVRWLESFLEKSLLKFFFYSEDSKYTGYIPKPPFNIPDFPFCTILNKIF